MAQQKIKEMTDKQKKRLEYLSKLEASGKLTPLDPEYSEYARLYAHKAYDDTR